MIYRPTSLSDIVGCDNVKEIIRREAQAAKIRNTSFPHMLISAGPGLGKTTISNVIATEMGTKFESYLSNVMSTKDDIQSLLHKIAIDSTGYDKDGNIIDKINPPVIFLDEIHQMKRNVQEAFFQAMEDFIFTVNVKDPYSGENRKKIYWVPRFTLIGATTRAGDLDGPFRERFKLFASLNLYTDNEIMEIIIRFCRKNELDYTDEAISLIAKRCRGIARKAVNFIERTITTLVILNKKKITKEVVEETFALLGIDDCGLDEIDIKTLKYLYTIYPQKIGVLRLASILNVTENILKDVIEPYLLRIGLIEATPSGRIISDAGREYCVRTGIIKLSHSENGISGSI